MFFEDPLFWISVKNTAYYALISVPLSLIVALLLAMLLNQKLTGIGFYRTDLLPAQPGAGRGGYPALVGDFRSPAWDWSMRVCAPLA